MVSELGEITLLQIGDILVKVNLEKKYMYDNFKDFIVKESKSYVSEFINWDVRKEKYSVDEKIYKKIIDNNNLIVYISKDKIIHKYCLDGVFPSYIVSSLDFKECVYYVDDINDSRHFKLCMFNVFREMFISAALFMNKFALHSSSIIYKGNGYAFCAPSGTGKTTHTSLWEKYEKCEILDGDIALVGMKENEMYIYGLPWCGTSQRYVNKCVRLNAVIFLEQSDENIALPLSRNETVKKLVMNNFSFPLTGPMALQCGRLVEKIVKNVDSYLLKCKPDEEAVRCIKECIQC